jgi:hypothetical protein
MLNDLEVKVAELEERMGEDQLDKIKALEEMFVGLVERIESLENPPKRPRGRPRKVNAE